MTEHEHLQEHDHDHGDEGHEHTHEHEHGDAGHNHTHEHDHNHEHTHEHEHEHSHAHAHQEFEDEDAHAAFHLNEFREAKDAWMRQDPHAPLTHEQKHAFQGLSYYPHNPALELELALDRDVPHDTITLDTSTGESQELTRAGKVHFEVDGQETDLSVFTSTNGELFVPLRDATSGKETYGAGRYLEPDLIDEDSVYVDFNYLYNPFCAYNEAYSCPLPPMENWLKVPLEAGEKIFH